MITDVVRVVALLVIIAAVVLILQVAFKAHRSGMRRLRADQERQKYGRIAHRDASSRREWRR